MSRFFLADLPEVGTAILDGVEAHHLMHVLRGSPGDHVELFNGSGLVANAEIVALRRRDAELRILKFHHEPPATRQIVLATAVPKGDRFDWLIEKATELGISRLVPLVAARSVVDPREGKLDKLRQTVIAACKQSGRNHLLQLSPVTSWAEFVKHEIPNHVSFLAHPGPEAPVISSSLFNGKPNVVIAIGPEGGFTDEEVEQATGHGAQLVSLGPLILRIETAALAAAACALASATEANDNCKQ